MTETIPVFVNGRRVLITRGGTAAMAAAAGDPAFSSGAPAFTLTDARGLPVPPDAVLPPGAILRVGTSARRASGADADA